MKSLIFLIPLFIFCSKNPMASHDALLVFHPQTVNGVFQYIASQEKQNNAYYLNIILDRPGSEVIKYFESLVGPIEDRRPFFYDNRSWTAILSLHYPTD